MKHIVGRDGWRNIEWSGANLPSGLVSPTEFMFYCPWCQSQDPQFIGLRGAMVNPETLKNVVGSGNLAIRQHFEAHMTCSRSSEEERCPVKAEVGVS